jgi:Domain of unknown function (DUF5050)
MEGVVRHAAAAVGAALILLGAATGVAAAAPDPPSLAFSPSPYDYGQVTPGHAATQTFMLTNTGGQASHALTITVPGSSTLAITADTCTRTSLGPGKSCAVTVQFAPAIAGAVTGTLTATNKSTVLATDLLAGTGVVSGHLYWAEFPDISNGDDVPGGVFRANLDGSDVTNLVSGLAYGVAVGNGRIYWSDGQAIMAANLDGSDVTSVIAGVGAATIAVDGTHIYWAVYGPSSSADGSIMQANLDGTGVTTLLTDQTSPIHEGIAVTNGRIYWSDTAFGGRLMAANLDGTGVTTLVSGVQLGPYGVAADSSHLYWTEKGPYIKEANLDGTGVTTLFSGAQVGNGYSTGIAVDSSHIYWIVEGPTIMAANLDGSGATTLVAAQGFNATSNIAVGP